jgi:hypothetical protein
MTASPPMCWRKTSTRRLTRCVACECLIITVLPLSQGAQLTIYCAATNLNFSMCCTLYLSLSVAVLTSRYCCGNLL